MSLNQQEEIELGHNRTDIPIIVNKHPKSAYYDRKNKSKPIRVLTVLAYILSVSLAAIILSIYYVFIWDGKPTLAYRSYLRTGGSDAPEKKDNNTSYENNTRFSMQNLKTDRIASASLVIASISKIVNDQGSDGNDTKESGLPLANGKLRNQNESSNEVQPTINFEDPVYYLTTPIEENSTWLPEIVNDFDGDYNEFQTEPIFIKKLFGYHKVKVK